MDKNINSIDNNSRIICLLVKKRPNNPTKKMNIDKIKNLSIPKKFILDLDFFLNKP